MDKAQRRRLYTALAPDEPLYGDDPRYVDFRGFGGAPRGQPLGLARRIELSERPTLQLVAGPRGTGMSTEFWRLARALGAERPDRLVLVLDPTADGRRPGHLDHGVEGFLVDMLVALSRALNERDSKAARSFADVLYRALPDVLPDPARNGTGTSLLGAGAFVGLTAQLPRPPWRFTLLEAVELAHKGVMELHRSGIEDVVLLVDEPGGVGATNDAAEPLFFHLSAVKLPFHLVVNVPLSLTLRGLHSISVLPVLRLRHRDGDTDPAGFAAARQIVLRRVPTSDLERLLGPSWLEELDRLIDASGGCPRALLRLVRDLLVDEELPASADAVTRAIRRDFENVRRAAMNEELTLLADVAANKSTIRVARNQGATLDRVVSTGLLNPVANGELWWEVHPGLRDLVAPRGAGDQAGPRVTERLPDGPVLLERLCLEAVRGIAELDFTFHVPDAGGQWIVLLGPNGVGKTTILRSLALALRNLENPAIWPKDVFSVPWARGDAGDAVISVGTTGRTYTTRISPGSSLAYKQIPSHLGTRAFPVFAYGCRRGSALAGERVEVDPHTDNGPEIATLFDEDASLVHAEQWLIKWDGDASKRAESKVVFDAVACALAELLGVKGIVVRERAVHVVDRDGTSLPLRAMSDGYLTSAGWFVDLVAWWVELARSVGEKVDAGFLGEMRGLVLIDEIDLHLHPRWQIEVIGRTRRLLPQMSFVVTTHNPLTLVGATAAEIWVLSRVDGKVSAQQGREPPLLLTGGQLFSRYFGIEDIYPADLGRKLQRYGFLSGYALRNDAEDTEMSALRAELRAGGLDPGWEEVPRERPPAKPRIQRKKTK